MRCKYCNAKLGVHDLWCVECGRQTEVVSQDLSAWESIKRTWGEYKSHKTENIPAASISVLAGAIPMLLLFWFYNNLTNLETDTTLRLLISLGIKGLVFSIFSPLIIIAFSHISKSNDYTIMVKDIKKSLKSYPSYMLLCLITALFYILIYIVCFGLPSFGSDPILRLVWIVLAAYWLSIVLPVPMISEIRGMNMLAALRMSYRHFYDVRWNLFLMALILIMINFLAFIFFVVGLSITIPFSMFAVRDYVLKLDDYELLDYRR